MSELKFVIPGNPLAKKRPRFARRGKFVTTNNAQESEEGKFIQVMMSQLNGHSPIPAGTPVWLLCKFFMPVPVSMPKKNHYIARHTKKPDLDNLVKFVKDCANGILWADDSQVSDLSAVKNYSWEGSPRTEITINWS